MTMIIIINSVHSIKKVTMTMMTTKITLITNQKRKLETKAIWMMTTMKKMMYLEKIHDTPRK